MDEQEPKAIITTITLFPSQRQIVALFADENRRSFSNAIQFIIEDWARMKREAIQAAAPTQPQAA